MRIKWTSISSVVASNPLAPWVGPGLAERLKQEIFGNSKRNKEKKKTPRAIAWLRRTRDRT